jgi:squalene-associated FAD-dependent desaturase
MKVHVVGAGLAGLGAATDLAESGIAVELSEAAAQAGGRCRSYFDAQVGLVIDNGNHLALSGNAAVRRYLTRLGASDRLAGPRGAEFGFVDLRDGARWTLRPNAGALPWWILSRARGVPGARLADYLALAPLATARAGRRVDEVVDCRGPVWEKLMRPFLLAALNVEPERGAADLARVLVRETLMKGGAAYAPRVPHPSLAAAFVEPALAYLAKRDAAVRLHRRLLRLDIAESRVRALEFADGRVELGPDGAVVLAVPPWVAADLLPGLDAPDAFEGIVNGHFRAAPPPGAPLITGVIGGTVEWVFSFEDRISGTVSGANHLMGESREALASRLWDEVVRALALPAAPLPPWQIVKEKRATFEATPAQQRRRPAARTGLANLVLAGDWTDTGLPGTIEGALRSGFRAADLVRESLREKTSR